MGSDKKKNPANGDIYRVLVEIDIQIVLEVGVCEYLSNAIFL